MPVARPKSGFLLRLRALPAPPAQARPPLSPSAPSPAAAVAQVNFDAAAAVTASDIGAAASPLLTVGNMPGGSIQRNAPLSAPVAHPRSDSAAAAAALVARDPADRGGAAAAGLRALTSPALHPVATAAVTITSPQASITGVTAFMMAATASASVTGST